MRQCGSGRNSEFWQEQGGGGYALDEVPVLFLGRWGVSLRCRHISGVQNGASDALSRNALPSFQRLVPGANESATVLPDRLLECLVLGTPDWTKVDWTSMFSRSF